MSEAKNKLQQMDLSILMDYVVSCDCVLMKHCNGAWQIHKTADDFIADKDCYLSQDPTEDFTKFMHRVVEKLMKDEENDEERLVAIDYAIWSKYKAVV